MRSLFFIPAFLSLFGCVGSKPITYIKIPQGIEVEPVPEKKMGELSIDYKKYHLANGLTVILHQDTSDPLVHVDLTYHVGSAREELGKSGFAHFFEHMMFQGSRHIGNQAHLKYITQAGGYLNGTTNKDRTNYYQTVPANELEKVLWLESDRMGYLLEAVSQEKFEIQRDTVKNERAQRIDNRPYGRVNEVLSAALYPPNHPYSWPTIGYVEDLNSVDVEDLKHFFSRWYGPNNATLTIGGDINIPRTLHWVDKYFSDIPSGPQVDPDKKQPVTLSADRFVTVEDTVEQPLLVMAWPTLFPNQQETYALDMFASILGQGRNSLLYQHLVKTEKAVLANAEQVCGELACQLQVTVLAKEGKDLTPIRDDILGIITRLSQRKITNDELTQVKGMAEANAIFSLESVEGKVSQLALNETFYGNPDRLSEWWQSINSVTPAQVEDALTKFVLKKPSVNVSVVPKGDTWLAAQSQNYTIKRAKPTSQQANVEADVARRITPLRFDRTQVPPAFGSVVNKVPTLYKTHLNNGITIAGTHTTETDTVAINFILPAGNLREPEGSNGVAALTAKMLREGTTTKTGEEIEAELDRLGSTISISTNREGAVLSLSTLRKNLTPTLILAADMMINPRFDPADFQRVKQHTLESLAFSRQQPTWLASQARREVLYEDLWHGLPSSGVLSTINNMSLYDIRKFYERNYTPEQTQVIVVGNINQQEMMDEFSSFSAWKGSKAAPIALPKLRQLKKQSIWIVDKPNAPQSIVQFVRQGLPFDALGEMYKLRLANFNLAGNFNSRLNQNLREEKGYTYGASGYVVGDRQTGQIIFQAQVRADSTVATIKEIQSELSQITKTGLTEEEIDFMRLSIGQSDALSYETPSDKANLIATIARFDLPDNYRMLQNNILQKIEKNELDILANKWFMPRDYQIIVVGDEKILTPQLKTLGIPINQLKLDI